MTLLIDGFNLIYKFPDLEELMYQNRLIEARNGLLNKLKEYQKIKKGGIRVVFDGKKDIGSSTKNESLGTIDIFYSLDYSADFLIKEFIKKDINPKMTTVVTSDKDILFFVSRFKVKVLTSENFADLLIKTVDEYKESLLPEKDENPSMTDDEISFWEKIFSGKRKNS